MARQIAIEIPKVPLVVGTIHSPRSLKAALRLKRGTVDLLEVRVDHFADDLAPLRKALPRLPAPRIITVRHPAEGGANLLGFRTRAELYHEFLPGAAYVDVEVRSAEKLAPVIAAARESGAQVILSDHHFRSTPGLARLAARRKLAHESGADIFKLATHVSTIVDLGALLAFLSHRGEPPMSVMGMGPFGKISRLLLARAGSLLNYGYLHEAQVPGQWEATLLKTRLSEL